MYSLVQSGWPVGSVLAAAYIAIVLPIGGWAWTFVVAVFPAIFILIAGRYLKESPQFMARHRAACLLREARQKKPMPWPPPLALTTLRLQPRSQQRSRENRSAQPWSSDSRTCSAGWVSSPCRSKHFRTHRRERQGDRIRQRPGASL
ncbi:MFS transporter [Paenarthrobacter sp. YAF11_1]|uniref:MFS transporter n=1 Tax=Paenarthrobacter sp. YAF11_1 TaxID=3233074 RepID=UPI003F98C881